MYFLFDEEDLEPFFDEHYDTSVLVDEDIEYYSFIEEMVSNGSITDVYSEMKDASTVKIKNSGLSGFDFIMDRKRNSGFKTVAELLSDDKDNPQFSLARFYIKHWAACITYSQTLRVLERNTDFTEKFRSDLNTFKELNKRLKERLNPRTLL
eukprot:Pgem_evm2s7139